MPLVSILVPCYNVEKYIGRCLDSLLNQSMDDLEVILINDGSRDETESIAADYAKRDERVRLFSYPNAGISHTRNRALSKARGKYILFVDSDDYVETDMLEVMVSEMEKRNLDVLQCGFVMDFGPFPYYRQFAGRKDYSTMEALHALSKEAHLNNYPWGKLYLRSCFEGIFFPENLPGFEDTCTIFKAIANAKKVGTIPDRFYHYWQRPGSLTNCMSLRTVYLMRYAYRYQQRQLEAMYPEERFSFDLRQYNTDMVIIYTLILFCHRRDHPRYIRHAFAWKNIPFVPVYWFAWAAWLSFALIKLGPGILKEPTADQAEEYADPFEMAEQIDPLMTQSQNIEQPGKKQALDQNEETESLSAFEQSDAQST